MNLSSFIIPYIDLICKAIFLVFQRLFQELLPDACSGAELAQNRLEFGFNWHEAGLEKWKKFLYNNVIELELRKSRNNISRNLQSLLKKERPFRKPFLRSPYAHQAFMSPLKVAETQIPDSNAASM